MAANERSRHPPGEIRRRRRRRRLTVAATIASPSPPRLFVALAIVSLSLLLRRERHPRFADFDTTTTSSSSSAFLPSFFPFLLPVAFGREADERSRFIYEDSPGASIILEYQLHNAPSQDYSGDERRESAKHAPGSEYDEERHIRPYFLTGGEEVGPRVVQFYSPWCGHCQAFKAKYVSVAKEVSSRLHNDEPEVHFHAVSCSVYHWVCLENRVTEYPTIVAYKANSAVPIRLRHLNANAVADAVGVGLRSAGPRESWGYDPGIQGEAGGVGVRGADILGASLDGLARTREAVYRDAALSFTHALKTGIFPAPEGNHYEGRDGGGGRYGGGEYGGGGHLSVEKMEALSDWIDFLYWSLPPTWQLHTLINDVRNNLGAVSSSRENLVYAVDRHIEVVNGGHRKWSEQCSKGVDSAGYPCGLWSLLHIASVGVSERHQAVLGSQEHVSTRGAAEAVKNYVEHFFGCEVCRVHFAHMYNSCGFDHCRRFTQSKLPSKESWKEFALWLWEVHNNVNEKLAEAEAKREGWPLSKAKARQARWPSEQACPECMDEKGTWNMDAVFNELKKQYWPGGVQNFRFVVLHKKGDEVDDKGGSGFFWNLLFYSGLTVLILWCAKKQRITATGRHKKYERRREHFP